MRPRPRGGARRMQDAPGAAAHGPVSVPMVSLGVTRVPGAAAPQMDIALGFHYHQFQFFQGNARPL